jgi:membrane-associated protease RseP (regulator of RpoE activity)
MPAALGAPASPEPVVASPLLLGKANFAVGLGLPLFIVAGVVFPTITLIIGLLLVVLAMHEAGHLIVGVRAGIVAQEYVVGSGPVVFRGRTGRTEVVVKAVPLTGFVRWADLDTYMALPIRVRAGIQAAGPFVNVTAGMVGMYAALLAAGTSPGVAAAEAIRLTAGFPTWIGEVLFTGRTSMWSGFGVLAAGPVSGALMFFALIHLAMGVLNLLPIPPMDGGKLALGVYEVFSRRSTRLPAPTVVADRTRLAGFVAVTYLGAVHPALMWVLRHH